MGLGIVLSVIISNTGGQLGCGIVSAPVVWWNLFRKMLGVLQAPPKLGITAVVDGWQSMDPRWKKVHVIVLKWLQGHIGRNNSPGRSPLPTADDTNP